MMTNESDNEVKSDGGNVPTAPAGRGRVVVRGIFAIIAGVVVMMLGVAVYQGLFVMLPIYLRDPEAFQRMMELTNSPEELKAAYEAGEIPKLGNIALALTLGMDGLCAVAGGFTAATVAARRKLTHAMIVALLMCVWSLVYTLTSEVESILPVWVPWTRSLVSIPCGVIVGAWLCVRRRRHA